MSVTVEHSDIVVSVYQLIQTQITEYAQLAIGLMFSSSKGMLAMFFAYYLAFTSYGLLSGRVKVDQRTMSEIVTSYIVVVAIIALFSVPQTYVDFFLMPFVDLVFDLSSFFISFGLEDGFEGLLGAMGDLMGRTLEINSLLWEAASVTRIETYFLVSLAVIVFSVPVLLTIWLYVFSVLIAVLNLYVLFILGCFFMFMASFSKTRQYFWAWLKTIVMQVLNVAVGSIIVAVSTSVINKSMLSIYSDQFEEAIFNAPFVAAACVAWLCFLALMKGSELVSNLMNAQAGSNAGIVAGAVGVGALTMNTTKGLYQAHFGAREGISGRTSAGGMTSLYNKMRGVPNG